ncbi:MAG TPA: CHAT domain-containing protein, partial [Polyangiaceae bacterium]|nr:CHAT domain-containing protein [Polyangiaceae bacterium]
DAFGAARRARRRGLLSLARAQDSAPLPEAWPSAMAEYLRTRDAVEHSLERSNLCPLSERTAVEAELARLQARAAKAADELVRLSRGQLGAAESELREPGTGEALLLWMESNDGWHGFLQFEQSVEHFHTEPRPSGKAWLEPFESTLRRARRLSVLGLGELNREDVHSLSSAAPDRERLYVVYSLDLSPTSRHSEKERSVIVGDTLGDLPESSREVVRVARNWEAAGRDVITLLGADAQPARIRAALRDAKILHYAGHAHFEGPEGWGSYIPLQHARITVADLLTWGEAPNEVVLSACDAALEPGLPHTAGLGIAQAFVLAGARAVVAPSRRISDRAAAEFAESVSRRMSEGEDLTTAYHAVQATLARDSEARAFRLLVR